MNKIIIKILSIAAVVLLSLPSVAAVHGDSVAMMRDRAEISLVTCYPGPDIYELYGHTMLRVRYNDIDMVYNYGIFDFDSPSFMYRFVKGETDYKVAGYDAAYMLMGYGSRKVVEQRLNLTPEESMRVLVALVENARPENATYRYNYVYDNCATRPRDIIENVLGDRLHYSAMHDTLTFRQEMRRYNANYAWQQFGIDLVLGSGIDYTLSYLILHIGVQYLPNIVRLPSAVRNKETVQIGIVYDVPCPVDGSLQCHYQIQLFIHGSLHQVYTRSGHGCIQFVAVLYLP